MERAGILIVGGGKVGRSLYRRARTQGVSVTLVRGGNVERAGRLARTTSPSLVILAVRDDAIPEVADTFALALGEGTHHLPPIVHTSGRFGPEVLASVSARGFAVGQMHPLVSFVAEKKGPDLAGATLLLGGDARAVGQCRAFGKSLGMVPRRFDDLPRPLYHAAAALVANTAAALAEAASLLLQSGGASRKEAAAMIGPLLASVARNITAVGLPEALSGPVRRGDAAAVARHLEALSKHPGIRDLYRAGVLAQIPMAAMLGEAPPNGLREIQALIAHGGRKPIRSALIPRKR